MEKLWQKIKIWTKGIVIGIVFLYAAFFIVKNLDRHVSVWVFWVGEDMTPNTLELVICSFLAGVICTILFRAVRNALHQMREFREKSLKEELEKELAKEHEEKERAMKEKLEKEHEIKLAKAQANHSKSSPSPAPAAESHAAPNGDKANET